MLVKTLWYLIDLDSAVESFADQDANRIRGVS